MPETLVASGLSIDDAAPSADEFCELRVLGGLSAMTAAAAADALPRSLYAVTIRDGDQLVAMGRLVGDGIHNLITDVVVRPDQQGRGLSRVIMDRIIHFVDHELPGCAWVNLFADVPWLYQKWGFAVNESSVGMMRPRRDPPA